MNLALDGNVLIQGITEPKAHAYLARMLGYGTPIVAGVSSGHGGSQIQGVPVFDLVEQALETVGTVTTTILFLPPYQVLDGALEAIASGIRQIILITGGIPPLDMVRLIQKAEATQTLIIGPCSAGLIVPGKVLLGSHEIAVYTPGMVGIISRTNSLTYEVAWELTQAGLGQSFSVCLGREAFVGSSVRQWLKILNEDKATKAIVLVDRNGVDGEEAIAPYITQVVNKPVITYTAGRWLDAAPAVGHADVVNLWRKKEISPPPDTDSSTQTNSAQRKVASFKQVKIPVAERPSQIPELVKKALKLKG